MIPNFQNSSNKILGSSLSLPAHGRAGARATSSLAAHFAKRNTKFGGGGTPEAERFAFATGQNSAFGFSLKKVRISFSGEPLKSFPFPAIMSSVVIIIDPSSNN